MGASHGRWRLWPLVASAIFFAATTGSTSQASGVKSMITGGITSQPIGHYEYCQRFSAECSIQIRNASVLSMTDEVWSAIDQVNRAVNKAVRPMSDFDIYGQEEFWGYPELGVGDCEDYVLEKRRQLAARGISLANLLVTVLRKPDGEGHAVLTVRTDRGDFILDNLNNDIRPWYKTGYRFLKRQSSSHTGRWVTLREEQNMLVGSVATN
jgi:predicted transglutaminase-like cysteine proteinase